MKSMGQDKMSKRIYERVGLLMVRGQYRSALELLDKVIEEEIEMVEGPAK